MHLRGGVRPTPDDQLARGFADEEELRRVFPVQLDLKRSELCTRPAWTYQQSVTLALGRHRPTERRVEAGEAVARSSSDAYTHHELPLNCHCGVGGDQK